MRCLLLLALSGCALVASSHDVAVPRSTYVTPTFVGPPMGLVLNVTESYRTLHVDATRTRTCFREVRQLIEHHTEVDSGPLAGVGVMALVAVANGLETESSVEDRSVRVTASDCSFAASGAPIAVALPSGAVVRAVTDGRGLAHIKIPADEPASGTVIVRAGETAVRVAYSPAN